MTLSFILGRRNRKHLFTERQRKKKKKAVMTKLKSLLCEEGFLERKTALTSEYNNCWTLHKLPKRFLSLHMRSEGVVKKELLEEDSNNVLVCVNSVERFIIPIKLLVPSEDRISERSVLKEKRGLVNPGWKRVIMLDEDDADDGLVAVLGLVGATMFTAETKAMHTNDA
ncbi:hypothetical protein C8R48DRAFT_672815 [Suillus tomentosus]|nr:hypothetical protein C8R48DRAFT_672815 [Suillus tomentosus]